MRRTVTPAPSTPATWALPVQAAALCVFAVLFEDALRRLEAAIPRGIYEAPSFTWALLAERPAFLAPAALALALAAASLTRAGRERLGWPAFDSIGGLRWVVFGVMLTLAWPHAAYPYNHYYDQAHLLDRALVLAFLLASLRSPAWIPLFALQVVLSRVQRYHPIHQPTPITDELPLRVLGGFAGFAYWNLLAGALGGRLAALRESLTIRTPVLVYATLCSLGVLYVYAGIGKLELGAAPFDWARQYHLENLFVSAWLNGWNAGLSEATALEVARWVQRLSLPVAMGTLALELAMLGVLARRWLTLALLAALVGMHLAIVTMTGVFFWIWAVVDACLLAWLVRHWGSDAIRGLYAPRYAAASLVIIAMVALLFGHNRFAWWNTRWTTVLELEAVDGDGNLYALDYSIFSPYLLTSFWKPYGPSVPGLYGATHDQRVMQRIQATPPEALKQGSDARWTARHGPDQRHPALDEFVQRFFRNRNANLGERILALPPPPTLRMRSPRRGVPYHDQAPVAEVRVRYVEKLYTGDALLSLRDVVVHTIRIPAERAVEMAR